MADSLYERTNAQFSNYLMLAATFLDPRYRSLRFIKDQTDRDMSKFKAFSYIKGVHGNMRFYFLLKSFINEIFRF